MSDQRDEKFDEKDREKRDEKSPQEKSWEEKYRRDPVSSVSWAAILVWAGLVLLADNLGLLSGIQVIGERLPGFAFLGRMEAWSMIFIGAGIIVLAGALVRLMVPEYRQPLTGTLILGLVLIGIGFGNIFGVSIVWPLILIAIGLGILLRGFQRGR
jgi:hypothetical protein